MLWLVVPVPAFASFVTFAFLQVCKSISFGIVDGLSPGLLDTNKKHSVFDTSLSLFMPTVAMMTCFFTGWIPEFMDRTDARAVEYVLSSFVGAYLTLVLDGLWTDSRVVRKINRALDLYTLAALVVWLWFRDMTGICMMAVVARWSFPVDYESRSDKGSCRLRKCIVVFCANCLLPAIVLGLTYHACLPGTGLCETPAVVTIVSFAVLLLFEIALTFDAAKALFCSPKKVKDVTNDEKKIIEW